MLKNARTIVAGLFVSALSLFQTVAADEPAASDEKLLSVVAPELRPGARQFLQATANSPPLNQESLADFRKMKWDAGPRLPEIPVEMRKIPGPAGAPELGIVIINAQPGKSLPGILHTHGGGYVLGDAASNAVPLQHLAQALDCVIVSVEYRLAPETTWQGSIEDNYTGLKWLHDHAAELGVDPDRIAVMGESAGGGHAALLALAARDRGEVPILLQVLIYPMLDDRTGSSRAVPESIGKLVWTAASNRFGWASFLGQAPGTDSVPSAAVPARREDLAGLPPAFIGVGGIDLFVDEDIEYARRLTDAGVPTELVVVPGAFHGFDGIGADTVLAKQFNEAKIAALRRALENAK